MKDYFALRAKWISRRRMVIRIMNVPDWPLPLKILAAAVVLALMLYAPKNSNALFGFVAIGIAMGLVSFWDLIIEIACRYYDGKAQRSDPERWEREPHWRSLS